MITFAWILLCVCVGLIVVVVLDDIERGFGAGK